MSIEVSKDEFRLRVAAHTPRVGLIGRDAEIASLLDEADASAISGRALIVRGEAGIGKSALVSAFSDRAGATHTTLRGRCDELESHRPFGAFADVLGSLRREIGEERSDALIRRREILRKLLEPTAHQTPIEGAARGQVAGSFLGVVDELMRERPLLITLEDLHWADEGSLELFGYLARKAPSRRLMLLGTARSEVDLAHPLREVVAQLTAARALREMSLAPLDERGTRGLIGQELGVAEEQASLAELAKIVYARCAGNPLFTEEVLRTLIATRRLRREGNEWRCARRDIEEAMPASIIDGVRGRMTRLDPLTQRFVAVASVAGDGFDVATIATVLEREAIDVLPALREAVTARLLVEGPDATVSFPHALLREAAGQTLLALERRLIHMRIAELLEAGDPPQRRERIAYHFDKAGALERARAHYVAAMYESMSLSATAHTVRVIERVLELTPEGDVERLDLLEKLTRYLGYSGQTARAETAARTLLAESEARHEPAAIGRALITLAYVFVMRQDRAAAEPLLLRARELIEPLGPSTDLAQLSQMLAWHAIEKRAVAEGIAGGKRTIEIANATPLPTTGDEQRRLTAMVGAGWGVQAAGHMFTRQWDEALRCQRKACEIGNATLDPRGKYSNLNNLLAILANTSGDTPEARSVQEQLRAHRDEHGIQHDHAVLGAATDMLLRGDFHAFRVATSEFEKGSRPAQVSARLLGAVVDFAQRDELDTREALDRARTDVARGDAANAAFWSGVAFLVARRFDESLERARHEFMPAAHVYMSGYESGRACLVGAVAARQAGVWADASAFRERALDPRVIDALALPGPQSVQAPFVAAETAAARHDHDNAIAAYAEAVQALQRMSFMDLASLWLEHLARLQRAELLSQRGSTDDVAAAQAEVDIVARYWKTARADNYLAQLATWARPRGLTVPANASPASRTAPPLSPREQEIATDVARGMTNREIATRLTLSIRTIDSHVEQIRAKLGFHTRAQIAAWVTERYGPQRAN